MPETLESWDPNDWEEHVYSLLSDRHGALNVSPVPARDKGDWGIDYYSLSDKAVYQCYAVQEPCMVSDRASKQVSKITGDLGKFCHKKTELAKLFGSVQINRWALVVPLHDSASVNTHLTKKTADVLAAKLPYVASDFQALIQCPKSFASSSVRALELRRLSNLIIAQDATQLERTTWAENASPLVEDLRKKLAKRIQSSSSPDQDTDKAIGWFLNGQNLLQILRSRAPSIHDRVLSAISRRLDLLELAGPSSSGSAETALRTEFEGLKAELKREAPHLSDANVHTIAMGALAEWLMRCPLDFPPYG
ncbi:hypothetical protein DFR29_11522 [Tahibacter aquaticus]|uniref:Uncharacterized protein n=1 Tax=Tahibacter aquaticus TaxID=520092 RepID=A0A4R6YPQ1_9GAMM|nr:hypothetical protein [Tahibacter aquaticus]TDR39634.1 hypothetical protein DFR29_11522 [Tahibacter aquaticus]